MWLGDPSRQEAALCAHRFPGSSRAREAESPLCAGEGVRYSARRRLNWGFSSGREACQLRNAGSRLELAGSCLRRARRSRHAAHSLPSSSGSYLGAEGSRRPLCGDMGMKMLFINRRVRREPSRGRGEMLPWCFGRHVLIGASRLRPCQPTVRGSWGMHRRCNTPANPQHQPGSIWAARRDSPARRALEEYFLATAHTGYFCKGCFQDTHFSPGMHIIVLASLLWSEKLGILQYLGEYLLFQASISCL